MFDLFTNINVDWMGIRRPLIAVSIFLLLAGLVSAVGRQVMPGGTEPFNLGVDFKGGTQVTAKFKGGTPSEEDVRSALKGEGFEDSVIQASLDKTDELLITVPLIEGVDQAATGKDEDAAKPTIDEATKTEAEQTAAPGGEEPEASQAENVNQVNEGRKRVREALKTFGTEAPPGTALAQAEDARFEIVGTASVGPVRGKQLRNQAVMATLLGMVGILLFIAFRYDWTYAAGAVIAVFHDVLITLAFFTMFQWEVSLVVLAALLTLVGFSVNDSIVIFDRIRENLTLDRKKSLYDITNDSINQTMSRTIVTNGLVFLAVLALVLFGGEVLRGFSLALFVGAITGTYSTIAIASPIAIWWQTKLGEAKIREANIKKDEKLATAARRSVTRRPVSR